jgi:hypothetical protein
VPAAGYTPLDVLAVPAGTLAYFRRRAEVGRVPTELIGVLRPAPVLASARDDVLSCPAWALPAADRKALAERLRSLAWLVENCVPDEAESRVG